MAIEALEHLGAHKSCSVLLRIEGAKISYGIAPAKLAWDQVIVLGTINITQPIPVSAQTARRLWIALNLSGVLYRSRAAFQSFSKALPMRWMAE